MMKLPDKIKNDIHIHSFRSRCAQDSYRDLEVEARERGLDSIAITDHGPDLGGLTIPVTFLDYRRTPPKLEGVRVYRGIEANLRNNGTTDVPEMYYKQGLDIVLLGLHSTKSKYANVMYYIPPENPSVLLSAGQSETYYTDLLLKAISNCNVDAITHPYIKFSLCLDPIIEACKEKGIAIELNNASFKLEKAVPEKVKEIIDAINKYEPRIVITSDAHSYTEIGQIDAIKAVLEKYPIEADVEIVNLTLESTEEFVKERKSLRQK